MTEEEKTKACELFGKIATFDRKSEEYTWTILSEFCSFGEKRTINVLKNGEPWFDVTIEPVSLTTFRITSSNGVKFEHSINDGVEGGTKEMLRFFYNLKIRGAHEWPERDFVDIPEELLEPIVLTHDNVAFVSIENQSPSM